MPEPSRIRDAKGKCEDTAHFRGVAIRGRGLHARRLASRQGTVPDALNGALDGAQHPVADAPARRASLRPHDLATRVRGGLRRVSLRALAITASTPCAAGTVP